jgi:hypothetical protein
MRPITLHMPGDRKAKITTWRQFRAIVVMMKFGPTWREALDKAAGASNSPQIVSELRSNGLSIECSRVECLDRDGAIVRPGLYELTYETETAFRAWLRSDDCAEWMANEPGHAGPCV